MIELKKINVGCGYDKRPGHLNVDMDPACRPDILISDNNFSELPRRHFDTLVAHDVLEHIPRSESLNALLEWSDLMTVGGTLELQTSNVIAVAEMMKSTKSYQYHAAYTVFMFGNQMHPGDFHYTGFTHVSLAVLLEAAGFEVVEMSEHDTWLLKVEARKALDWSALLAVDTDNRDFVQIAYAQALDREPEEAFLPGELALASNDRRALLKKLFGSEERCLRVAHRMGY